MRFTPTIGEQYMGHIEQAYLSYCADPEIRDGAASGGAVSALLLHLLETRRIDKAVVTGLRYDSGCIQPEVFMAHERSDILQARTSKYFDTPLVARTVELVRSFDGPVAVVALPCHVASLRNLMERDACLRQRIRYIIALFCGHSSDRFLLDELLRRKGIDQSKLVDFAFRRGRWRGKMQGRLADGTEFAFPFSHFSLYHNLNFFCLNRCLGCHDHMGYNSDFSAGDAWLSEMKSHPIKHSVIFSRHQAATEILDEMMQLGKLIGHPIDPATVFRSQKRSLIYHYNTSARSRAAARHGMTIHDTVHAPVRWNDALAARLILRNVKASRQPRMRQLLLGIPRPILWVYFLFLKFLQNF